ncbi:MAG: Gldg family protein [Acetobacteraceae bacterium]|nr:Gldg family protein [Acetobacteraceae bacterium]
MRHPFARSPAFALLGLAAAVALAVGVNMLVARFAPHARLDLTEQRLYTLSDGTRQIVGGLTDPVTLRLFYSRRLGATIPAYGAFAERVRAMLDEYVAISGGKIRLELFDPEPFSEAEDRALGYGLQGVPVDQSGEQVYFGLVGLNLLDDERSIPFFQLERERFLEADLTRLIYELSNPRRPVLGILTSLPLSGDPRAMMMRIPGAGQPFVVATQLRQFFTVREIAADARAIDPEIQVLLVAHPPELPEPTLYAIDQFVMRGGRLMVLTDPHSDGQAFRPAAGGGDTSSNLDRLLNAWGIETPRGQVIGDLSGAWRVRASPQDRVQAVDYVAWFTLGREAINRDDPPVAQLESVTFASAGEVRLREGAAVEMVPLVLSSDRSAPIPVERVRQNPEPARILAEFRPDGQRRVLLARFRGVLDSAFPLGPPEDPDRPADLPAHLARSSGPANLVVGNDADILEDRFWVRVQDFFGQQVATPFSGNGALVLNLLEALAGGDALIGLRSRGEALRPFTLVERMRRDAEAQFRQRERALAERLQATEQRLRELRQGGGQQAQAAITAETQAEIDRARQEILRTRAELRAVQRALRQDIEALETWLRIANIAAVPALLVVLAVLIGLARARRRAAARG